MEHLKRYLVGGAVRDRLLGRPSKDLDWLVMDTTKEALLSLGFRQVGKSFPVFLHPKTSEEHSFPRGPGTIPGQKPTIEMDLARRDLTINAIAIGPDGEMIDPLGGKGDLEQRLLRHTPAFTEDPLRIIRTVRLLADLSPYGFSIASETLELMQTQIKQGALKELPKERIWNEFERALNGPDPVVFFETLRACEALCVLMPELDNLFGVPQPEVHHPEIDCGVHALLSLSSASILSQNPEARFAALIHDLGKGLTPSALWPKHHGHEKAGVALVKRASQRVGAPKSFENLAKKVCEYHTKCHQSFSLRPGTLLKLLQAVDAIRNTDQFEFFLTACMADARGRDGFREADYPQANFLNSLATSLRYIDFKALNISEKSTEQRIALVNRVRLEVVTKEKKRLLQPTIIENECNNS